jgi:Pregnancy-associated plasma protein-A
MKKTIIALTGCLIFALSCTKETETFNEEKMAEPEIETPVAGNRCASDEVLQQQLMEDPGLAVKMQAIEELTARYVKNPGSYFISNGNVVIPVVVNVLYKTAAQNISQAQIQSQIDVLNADFSALNTDYSNTPSYFQAVRSGDLKIRFVLDQVIRKSTTKSSWRTDDAMKKSNKGGINPTSPSNKLNLWVCNLSGGILGYAQFPGGNAATDGVVCDDNATGNTGTAAAPYGLGRTATHEIGHWLNLRHIWGDATCGNDFVSDTPLHQTSNGGCPAFPKYGSCSATIPMQTMNYMDYTYDACMYMFSTGQGSRMNATFLAGGGRTGFAQ